jgi:DNA-binding transcriptional ArsR family regulator
MYAIRPQAESEPDIWHALADPTRRLLIDRLAGGARTTSQLCENVPMSRFGVMKHLGILERAGLVIARRHGRLRLNHLNAAPLRALHTRWASARADILADAAIALATDIGATDMPESQPSAQAQIVDVALEWPVEASVQRVWQSLFERVEAWWPAAHRAVGGDAAMTFEARLGGQLREAGPAGGGIVWYQIIALDPLRSVDLAGHLAARYGGPAASLLHIEIAPGARDGTAILKLTDSVFGRIGPNMRASLTSGWQAIVGEGLVAHLAGDG